MRSAKSTINKLFWFGIIFLIVYSDVFISDVNAARKRKKKKGASSADGGDGSSFQSVESIKILQ